MTALTAAGCGGGNSRPGSPTSGGTPPPGTTSAASATPGATRTVADPTLTISGFVVSDGRFDPHKAEQVGTLHGQQAFVYSRLVSYLDQAAGSLVADLAADMPEQPDSQTYVFQLNPAATWHDIAPLNGRRVTSADVRHSLERQINGGEAFIGRDRWIEIESIETPSDDAITIRTSAPVAGMLSRLADPRAFVVPVEHDDPALPFDAYRQMGSGPFQWVEWDEGRFASVVRNDAWFGGTPQISGVTVRQPQNTDEVEADFRVRKLDVAFLQLPHAERLREALPQLVQRQAGNASYFVSRFVLPQPPFDDPRLRTALSIAIDRYAIIDSLFAGSGAPSGWVSWPVTQWALPASELSGLAGYRRGSGARDQDIAEARALLEAMRGEGKEPPATLTLSAAIESEQETGLAALIAAQVGAALNIDVTVNAMPLADLARAATDGAAPWLVAPDTGWLDLDDWVYPYFHSTGTRNTFAIRHAVLDELLDRQRVEFNVDARRQLGFEIQRLLLQINPGVNIASERIVTLSWPYVRDFPLDVTDGYQDRFARTWIDTADPSYRAR